MKTRVYVCANNADPTYTFDISKNEFVDSLNEQMTKKGYFSMTNSKGAIVIIFLENCSIIEISEVEE